ncbi:dockerin type I repeat protein [Ruminiclostridium sufflavum DSM 19573]|uniref:cellulase n=1 Tax=Ruminiclostridium sufflavum DSM 19573 TaxID=1121337 RepID=A0A318XMN7_9FIRM|nr:dockerin type I domain-containing protein [Ruminiclostridium sufflavum]PYG86909.1 dockerin type I repeat protein [Ruminiclostridium sufflavum DSM 19573]
MFMKYVSFKRSISFLLCFSILACVISLTGAIAVPEESQAATVVYGDLNSDGAVDALDIALVKQNLLGNTTLTSAQKTAGDVDASGSIDAIDFALMKQYLLKIIEKFPADTGVVNPPVRPIPDPSYSELKTNSKLPDPFKFYNGDEVTTKADWINRQKEISYLAQKFEYGFKPEAPDSVKGSFSSNKITVTVTDNGKSISFSCSISYPSTGKAPYPAVIGIGMNTLNTSTLTKLGCALITFPCDELGAQSGASSRGTGKFYDLYGKNHSAGSLMAWAWGVDRLIDALESTPAANIDAKHLGVTGGSRYGKGALACGAFNERIALTIPQESGAGGAASWRVSDWQKSKGQNVQTAGQIVTENPWQGSAFSQFGSSVTKLPFDHHMIEGLCAPRGLLVIENSQMEWLGNVSCFTTGKTAHMIYEALGVPDSMGYSSVGHPDHCGYPASQIPELEAFVKKFLLDDSSASTAYMKQDGGVTFDKATWVDWDIPALK